MAAIVPFLESEKYGSRLEPGIDAPAIVAASTPAAPSNEASTTFPLRNRYMYQPTARAIGTVQAIVNVPQELPGTSRIDPLGSVMPPALFDSRNLPGGTASWNDSWKV